MAGRRLRCAVAAICLVVLGQVNGLRGRQAVDETASVRFLHDDERLSGRGFVVLADRRIFAVMAFLNAVGLDEEAQGQTMHPIRIRVRQLLSANLEGHAAELAAWRAYYQTRGLQAFHYQDWALSLSADYPFRRIRPDSELGYAATASALQDLPSILNEFWRVARLAEVWNVVKPAYFIIGGILRRSGFTGGQRPARSGRRTELQLG